MKKTVMRVRRLAATSLFIISMIVAQFAGMSFAHAAGPTNFAATYVGGGTPYFHLTWTGDGSSSYSLADKLPDGSTNTLCSSSNSLLNSVTTTSADAYYVGNGGGGCTNFTAGATYLLTLTGSNGTSTTNATFSSSQINYASAPVGLAATSTSSNVTFTWGTPSTQGTTAISGYHIAWTLSTPGTGAVIGSNTTDVGATTLSYTIASAVNGNYLLVVTATNGSDGNGPGGASLNYLYSSGQAPQTPTSTTISLTDSQPTTDLTLTTGDLTVLDGSRQDVTVPSTTMLGGNGTVRNLTVQSGGTVAPGHSPGKITVLQSTNISGTYQAQLKDSTAGDYDQLQVSDPSRTTGQDVVIAPTAILDTSLYTGYNIKKGDQFMIINNLQPSSQKVSGTFSGLPEGQQFTVSGITFSITYVGGDGNDVVLTALSAGQDPKAPNTSVAQFVQANPLVVVAAGLASATMILLLSRKFAYKKNK